VRVGEASVALIPLTLPLSREGRGKRLIVKGINAFVLATRYLLEVTRRHHLCLLAACPPISQYRQRQHAARCYIEDGKGYQGSREISQKLPEGGSSIS
jgi:hypothetical protein